MVYWPHGEEFAWLLAAKLEPRRIRATLEFAGLYQLTHEMIKDAVLPRVKDSIHGASTSRTIKSRPNKNVQQIGYMAGGGSG